jgi:hypothetical protein
MTGVCSSIASRKTMAVSAVRQEKENAKSAFPRPRNVFISGKERT